MSALSIVRTSQSEDDLITIWLHVGRDSESAADRLLDRIEARWGQLVVYPFSGAPREDIGPGIRHQLVGEYLTLYRVHDDAIEIVRVPHGRRKIGADDISG